MKKCFNLVWVAILLITLFGCITNNIVFAKNSVSLIKTIAIRSGKNIGVANLYGNGETFITDIKVDVNFYNYQSYTILLEDGYSPSIETFDFGGDDKLLFYSSQTGGSGGYGNYQIYLLRPNGYKLIYDDKENSKNTTFNAKFLPDGIMKLENNQTKTLLSVDVKYMDKSFYKQIFAKDGSVIGADPYVNYISFVSPAFNPANGVFRLISYRSVVAVAEVNRLGYIVQTLEYEKEKFSSVFTEFAIEL